MELSISKFKVKNAKPKVKTELKYRSYRYSIDVIVFIERKKIGVF